ncbi:MAG: polyprenyl synthetase family protein [Paludibacter sp.]|nr:polyprenyl synthetase family protein [Paludibacter sp.]
MNLDEIKNPIDAEFELFENNYRSAFNSESALLEQINYYLLQQNGKKLRPIIVLLAAKLCSGTCNTATIDIAVALELLHTASLIHDDVVDSTSQRHGLPSVNAQWTNKVAVLAGDFFLSKSLFFAAKTENQNIMTMFSQIGINLAEGELFQLAKENNHNISETEYLNIIRKKTALFFAYCASMGAISVNGEEQKIMKMSLFGEYLGTSFQIRDDIFDYFDNKNIGKPTGNDIREGKITLPLIFALQNSDEKSKSEILNIINNNDLDNKNISEIIDFTCKNGGIEYATDKMLIYKQKAIAELDIFPESNLKNALISCAEFAAQRNF